MQIYSQPRLCTLRMVMDTTVDRLNETLNLTTIDILMPLHLGIMSVHTVPSDFFYQLVTSIANDLAESMPGTYELVFQIACHEYLKHKSGFYTPQSKFKKY